MRIMQMVWPIAGAFTIARGSRTQALTVVVELRRDGVCGYGECTPYPRYGESVESVCDLIGSIRIAVENGFDRQDLQRLLPPGAARNAVDCALWDLEAKTTGSSAAQLAGLAMMEPRTTAYTISLGSPEEMAGNARAAANRELLKIKLGADGDSERMQAVREAAPDARLILDANEGWTDENAGDLLEVAHAIGASLVEQPLPVGKDGILAEIEHTVPVCADESLHTQADLPGLRARYDCVNIKLDKTGGLTEALATQRAARALGLQIMIGCMVASSLAMAPAMILAQDAEFVDLDGPLLLAEDCDHPIEYPGSLINPPSPLLWG
jgi:L-alanine-DL-glutamate epimerase-like enolase superfamily enzyme